MSVTPSQFPSLAESKTDFHFYVLLWSPQQPPDWSRGIDSNCLWSMLSLVALSPEGKSGTEASLYTGKYAITKRSSLHHQSSCGYQAPLRLNSQAEAGALAKANRRHCSSPSATGWTALCQIGRTARSVSLLDPEAAGLCRSPGRLFFGYVSARALLILAPIVDPSRAKILPNITTLETERHLSTPWMLP